MNQEQCASGQSAKQNTNASLPIGSLRKRHYKNKQKSFLTVMREAPQFLKPSIYVWARFLSDDIPVRILTVKGIVITSDIQRTIDWRTRGRRIKPQPPPCRTDKIMTDDKIKGLRRHGREWR